ncbi:MAG TPA: hypothetical protein VJ672_03460 [Gemmatimonadaceae bacterium]|nr:hypothetical protein [Gemmatimonadaceae bacterium]
MGGPEILVPIAFFITVAATIIGFPLARGWARKQDKAIPRTPPDVIARLERMEQAIDSIAIEVERISEGQRFTTKLLSERGREGAQLPPSTPER